MYYIRFLDTSCEVCAGYTGLTHYLKNCSIYNEGSSCCFKRSSSYVLGFVTKMTKGEIERSTDLHVSFVNVFVPKLMSKTSVLFIDLPLCLCSIKAMEVL